jgi:hypothetical protein
MSLAAQRKLADALTNSREKFGLRRSCWNGIVVVEFLQKVCNVQLKRRQARSWLKHLGSVLRQPVYRCMQATDENIAKFRRRRKKLRRILELGELALLACADERGLSLHPKLGRVWARRGTQPRVRTTSRHQKRLSLSGWVDPLFGWHAPFRRPKGNREGFLAFLKYLCHRIKGWKVYFYIDGNPWHKGGEIRDFLAAHPEIEMKYLAPYHREFNVQERVWPLTRY